MKVSLLLSIFTFFCLDTSWASPLCADLFAKNRRQASHSFVLTGYEVQNDDFAKKTTAQLSQAEPEWTSSHVALSPPEDVGFIPTKASFEYHSLFWHLSWGIESVHQNYGGRLSLSEKKLIDKTDWQNFLHQFDIHHLGYVTVTEHETVVGFLRVYNGIHDLMPVEEILKEKNISTDIFNSYRKQGFEIAEIGKYFLSPLLDSKDLKLVRKNMWMWFLKTYLDPKDPHFSKKLFIIDVSNEIHARTYERVFGAKRIAADHFSPPLNSPDSVLTVDAVTLRERILKMINSD